MDLLSFLKGSRFTLSLDFDKEQGLRITLTPDPTTKPTGDTVENDVLHKEAAKSVEASNSHSDVLDQDIGLRVFKKDFKAECIEKMRGGVAAHSLARTLREIMGDYAPAESTLCRWRVAARKGEPQLEPPTYEVAASVTTTEEDGSNKDMVECPACEEPVPVVPTDASDGEEPRRAEAVLTESMKDSMLEFMTCSDPFSPEVLSKEFNIPIETLQAWKDAVSGLPDEVPAVFTQNGRVDDEYREILARSFSEMIQNGHTQGNAAKQLGKSRTALVRWCERFGFSLEKRVHLSRKDRMRERREEGRKAREFVLSKAARSWFDLSRWGAETGYFPYKARSQCYQIAQKIQLGYTPSTALSVPCYKHWSAAVSLGWEVPQ